MANYMNFTTFLEITYHTIWLAQLTEYSGGLGQHYGNSSTTELEFQQSWAKQSIPSAIFWWNYEPVIIIPSFVTTSIWKRHILITALSLPYYVIMQYATV